jgi:hypothetical protein
VNFLTPRWDIRAAACFRPRWRKSRTSASVSKTHRLPSCSTPESLVLNAITYNRPVGDEVLARLKGDARTRAYLNKPIEVPRLLELVGDGAPAENGDALR